MCSENILVCSESIWVCSESFWVCGGEHMGMLREHMGMLIHALFKNQACTRLINHLNHKNSGARIGNFIYPTRMTLISFSSDNSKILMTLISQTNSNVYTNLYMRTPFTHKYPQPIFCMFRQTVDFSNRFIHTSVFQFAIHS